MKTSKTSFSIVVAFLALVSTAYGCSSSEAEEPTEDGAEGELVFGKGAVDNAGIVEATTIMLVSGLTELGPVAPPVDPALDPYNQSDPFAIDGARFQSAFARNLAKFDGYDDKRDWSDQQATAWASRMAKGNYLVVDTSKPCHYDNPSTYLEIERASLTGREHTTCGGRMPNEDALDVTLNFLMRGPAASAQDEGAITDGVASATKQSTNRFPYLAEMNGL